MFSFLGAILGGVLAAMLKEPISELFYKRKRKIEIRTALTENIAIYFRFLKLKVESLNDHKIHSYRKALLQKAVNEGGLLEENIKELNFHINGLYEHLKGSATRDMERYTELVKIESKILSLVIESKNYFTNHQYKQLHKDLYHIAKEGSHNKIGIDEYEGFDIKRIQEFQSVKYINRITEINHEVDERMRHYLNRISEILF